MLYLLATILLNVLLAAIFKLFPRYRIDALQAIVTNYIVCVITGSFFIGRVPFQAGLFQQDWFPWALLMGVGFIAIFNLIAWCTRTNGITTTVISNKLSLVIPVLFSVLLYHEGLSIFKVAGILLAIPAVWLTSRTTDDGGKPQNLFWPVLLFLGSGLLDTLVNFVQSRYLTSQSVQAVYAIYSFMAAAVLGMMVVFGLAVAGRVRLQWRNIAAGICVGIPNYFSIYFFIRALNTNFLHSSASIPVINIGILLASVLMAILFFRERAGGLRIIGLILSVAAILLIAFGDKT